MPTKITKSLIDRAIEEQRERAQSVEDAVRVELSELPGGDQPDAPVREIIKGLFKAGTISEEQRRGFDRQLTVPNRVIFDSEQIGFSVQITGGGVVSFQARYRAGAGRAAPIRVVTIGRYGAPWVVDAARKEAGIIRVDASRGVDPFEVRKQEAEQKKGAATVGELIDTFLDRHGSTKLKPRTREEYRRNLVTHAKPHIGNVAINDLSYRHIEKMHAALGYIAVTANRTVAAVSKLCSWAIKNEIRENRQNPCFGLERHKEKGRERFLSEEEVAAVGAAIDAALADEELIIWQAALFKCLMLTGLRRDELRTLRWRDIDFQRNIINLKDAKTGDRAAFLSQPVRDILEALPKIADNTFVFVGSKKGRPVVNVAKPWRRILQRAGIAATRLHDLRHSVASTAVAAGASLVQVGGVLGHVNERTTKRYAHLADETTRAVADLVAERVASAMTKTPAAPIPEPAPEASPSPRLRAKRRTQGSDVTLSQGEPGSSTRADQSQPEPDRAYQIRQHTK